ncbi:MAG TPA: ribonuclease III [Bacteroidota bacterium]|nr:ribonuclease III [Bacteroidota bacterium]
MHVAQRLAHWVARVGRFLTARSAPAAIDFRRLEATLGYNICHPQLFSEALSHRSYLQLPGNEHILSNERMEFLGDSVLNLTVAEYLYRHHLLAPEGELTKVRARLVNRKALVLYARELKLGDFLLMSPSASQVGGKGMETILADAFEAVIGAIYLDGGFPYAQEFVRTIIHNALEKGLISMDDDNFKSRLLEYAQAEGFGPPRYLTVNEEGPDHDRTFTVEVWIGNSRRGVGKGKNKKDAEQAAAEQGLQQLHLL